MYRQALLFIALWISVETADPIWGTWGEWGAACTECISVYSRGRTRVCIPGDELSLCSGSRLEQELCVNCTAQWSEWTIGTVCSDNCGLCGKYTRSRECTNNAGCPTPSCLGNSTDQNTPPCDNGNVCVFPKLSCCQGTKTADIETKKFYCKTN